jgi:hypothetical protein
MTSPLRMKLRTTRWIAPTDQGVFRLAFFGPMVALLMAGSVSAGGWHDFSNHARKVAKRAGEATHSGGSNRTLAFEATGEQSGEVNLVANLAIVDAASNCADAAEDCREEMSKLRADTLDSINLDIHVTGVAGNDYPCECRLEGEEFQPRQFASTTMTWKAAGYCHKPLYFEQWNLERYGHSYHPAVDPFISAAHFFASVPALPYKMGVELPWECIYPLGYYRPGDCAPWTIPAPPISARGAAVEAATATGIIFILP